MGSKNSKNRVKTHDTTEKNDINKHSQMHDKESTNTSLNEAIDDMILFHKVNSKNSTPNRSFCEDEQTAAENVSTHEENLVNQSSEQTKTYPASILVYSTQNENDLNQNFIKVKSRSDVSTRHVNFHYDTFTPSESVENEDIFKREKTKFNVRFAEKVLVMNSSDLDRLYFNALNSNNSIEIIDPEKIDKYFISLNDEKITSTVPKIKKRHNSKERNSHKDKNRRIVDIKHSNEFEKLRSWNFIKENTFYEDERKSVIA